MRWATRTSSNGRSRKAWRIIDFMLAWNFDDREIDGEKKSAM